MRRLTVVRSLVSFPSRCEGKNIVSQVGSSLNKRGFPSILTVVFPAML